MIREFADIHQASRAALEYILNVAVNAIKAKGFFTIVLSGGTTPKTLYAMLSAPTNAKKIAWQQTHVFWGDERWVAPSHHDSNFGLAREELLVNIPIPPHNIHPIATDFSSPEIAAEKYENDLLTIG